VLKTEVKLINNKIIYASARIALGEGNPLLEYARVVTHASAYN
jgi:hypothetical protein